MRADGSNTGLAHTGRLRSAPVRWPDTRATEVSPSPSRHPFAADGSTKERHSAGSKDRDIPGSVGGHNREFVNDTEIEGDTHRRIILLRYRKPKR